MATSASKEIDLTTKRLLFNARVHTQADGLIVDSLVLNKSRVIAVGRNLQHTTGTLVSINGITLCRSTAVVFAAIFASNCYPVATLLTHAL